MVDLELISNMKIFSESIPTGQNPNSVMDTIKACIKKVKSKIQDPKKYNAVNFLISSMGRAVYCHHNDTLYAFRVIGYHRPDDLDTFEFEFYERISGSNVKLGTVEVSVTEWTDLNDLFIKLIDRFKNESSENKK